MAHVIRVYWGRWHGRLNCTLTTDTIRNESVVLVATSEGDEGNSSASPGRFVGSAKYTVGNIAPFDGGVRFVVTIDWDDPIPFWTDIVVLDEFPQGIIR